MHAIINKIYQTIPLCLLDPTQILFFVPKNATKTLIIQVEYRLRSNIFSKSLVFCLTFEVRTSSIKMHVWNVLLRYWKVFSDLHQQPVQLVNWYFNQKKKKQKTHRNDEMKQELKWKNNKKKCNFDDMHQHQLNKNICSALHR